MTAEEGWGAWKLAEGSFKVAALAFFTAKICITPTEPLISIFSLNSVEGAVFFWLFF